MKDNKIQQEIQQYSKTHNRKKKELGKQLY